MGDQLIIFIQIYYLFWNKEKFKAARENYIDQGTHENISDSQYGDAAFLEEKENSSSTSSNERMAGR